MTDGFKLTSAQLAALDLLAGPQLHTQLEGGSRSGKTFILCRAIAARALIAPGSRHAILRFRFNHVKESVVLDTWPKMMGLCFPNVDYHIDKQDWYARLPNGSEVWFGGLDDKERTEKVLGKEFATIFLNEASQISYTSRNMVLTRLAQKTERVIDGKPAGQLPLREYIDLNPPNKGHWSYKLFHKRVDPLTNKPLPDADEYRYKVMNPGDNRDNLPPEYMRTLDSLPDRLRLRFRDGVYADDTPNALFSDDIIERWRVIDGSLPDMQRIVVAVDPSGSGDEDNVDNDAIGIVVAGLGTDGNAYVLEDCTVKAGPGTWANIVASAYDRHSADVIVAETNFGGAMVKATIRTAKPRALVKEVNASRGKVVRAEPFSALYEQGKVRHVGHFRELEDELTSFSTLGYMGEGSPNRADAGIWALAELFPGLTNERNTQWRAPLPKRKVPV